MGNSYMVLAKNRKDKAKWCGIIAWCVAFVWLGCEFMKGVLR